MTAVTSSPLLERAARYLRAEYEPWSATFRLPGDGYDHEAMMAWPGDLVVRWDGELQCRSERGDPLNVGSSDAELREAGVDLVRARALLEVAARALHASGTPVMQRQLPCAGSSGVVLLAEFRWPGLVRVLDLQSRRLIVQSRVGDPFAIDAPAAAAPSVACEAAAGGEIDQSATRQAAIADMRAVRDRLLAGQRGRT